MYSLTPPLRPYGIEEVGERQRERRKARHEAGKKKTHSGKSAKRAQMRGRKESLDGNLQRVRRT